MVDEGADFQLVDEALLSLGLPMAPFELLGMVGPAVAAHVQETLNRAFGPQSFPINDNLQKMVEAKIPGFYVGEPPNRQVDPVLKDLWQKKGDKEFRKEEIIERVLTDLTREIDLIMQEGVVADTRDVDPGHDYGRRLAFLHGRDNHVSGYGRLHPESLTKGVLYFLERLLRSQTRGPATRN